jgi:hypothetical protein
MLASAREPLPTALRRGRRSWRDRLPDIVIVNCKMRGSVAVMSGIPPARRVIRLFPDYSRDWPLWEDSTPTWDVGYTTTPATYGLSEALSGAMASWNAFWSSHFDPIEGWDSDANRERWRSEGEAIAAHLQQEVAAFANVQYEPWPSESY